MRWKVKVGHVNAGFGSKVVFQVMKLLTGILRVCSRNENTTARSMWWWRRGALFLKADRFVWLRINLSGKILNIMEIEVLWVRLKLGCTRDIPVLLNIAVRSQDYKIPDLLEFKGKDIEMGTHLELMTNITKSSEVPTVIIFRHSYFTPNTVLIWRVNHSFILSLFIFWVKVWCCQTLKRLQHM